MSCAGRVSYFHGCVDCASLLARGFAFRDEARRRGRRGSFLRELFFRAAPAQRPDSESPHASFPRAPRREALTAEAAQVVALCASLRYRARFTHLGRPWASAQPNQRGNERLRERRPSFSERPGRADLVAARRSGVLGWLGRRISCHGLGQATCCWTPRFQRLRLRPSLGRTFCWQL